MLTRGAPEGGTRLTVETARDLGRPICVVDVSEESPAAALSWIRNLGAGLLALNVAGPRESEVPGIYGAARTWLAEAFEQID